MNHSSEEPTWNVEALLREESWVRRIARDLVRDTARADDITQEVLSTALEVQPRFEGAQLRSWLRTVARRAAGALRRKDERRLIAEHEATQRANVVASSNERWDLHRKLHAGLQALPEDERALLVLRYLDGLSMREVGERLGIGELAARKRVQRARGSLRKQLGAEFGDEQRSSRALMLLAFGRLPGLGVPPLAAPLSLTTGLLTMKKLGLVGFAVVALILVGARVAERWTAGDVRSEESVRAVELVNAAPVVPALEESRVAPIAETPNDVRTAMPSNTPSGPRLIVLDPFGNRCPTASACWIDQFGRAAELFLDDQASAELPTEHVGRLFLATAPGCASQSIRSEKNAAFPLVLQLEETVLLEGRALVNGSPPVEPVRVQCLGRSPSLLQGEHLTQHTREALTSRGFMPRLGHTHTNGLGEFAIGGRHPDETGEITFQPSYRDASTGKPPLPSYTLPGEPLTIRLTRVPYISGRVIWADDGTPVTGSCRVRFTQPSSEHDSDYTLGGGQLSESGHFEAAFPMDFAALETPRLTHTIALLVARSTRGQSAPYSKTIELSLDSGPIDLGTIRLEHLLPFRVRVLDARGHQAEGALVWVNAGARQAKAIVNAAGVATINCSGAQTVAVYHTGSLLFEANTDELPLDDGGLRVVQLEPGPGLRITTPTIRHSEVTRNAVLIEIEYVSDVPTARVLLPLEAMTAFGTRARFHYGLSGNPELVSFKVAPQPLEVFGLTVGRELVIRLQDILGSTIAEQRVTPSSGDVVTDIVLRPLDVDRNSLDVRVLAPNGRQLENVKAYLSNGGDWPAMGVRVEGLYGFDPVGGGTCELRVISAEYLPYKQELEFGGGHRELTVTLTQARIVNVQVVSPPGETATADSVYLDGVNGWRSDELVFGFDNVFKFESIPLQPLTVVARFGDEEVRVPLLANETEVSVQAPER